MRYDIYEGTRGEWSAGIHGMTRKEAIMLRRYLQGESIEVQALGTMQPDDSIRSGTPVTEESPPDCSNTEDPPRDPATECNKNPHIDEGARHLIKELQGRITELEAAVTPGDLKRNIGSHSRSIMELYEILDTDVTKIRPADTHGRPLVLTDLAEMKRKQNRDAQRISYLENMVRQMKNKADE